MSCAYIYFYSPALSSLSFSLDTCLLSTASALTSVLHYLLLCLLDSPIFNQVLQIPPLFILRWEQRFLLEKKNYCYYFWYICIYLVYRKIIIIIIKTSVAPGCTSFNLMLSVFLFFLSFDVSDIQS